MKIGSAIHSALSRIGITQDAVSKVIGRPCGCKQRAEALDAAVERLLSRTISRRTNVVWLMNRLNKFARSATRHYYKEVRRRWHKIVGSNGGCASCGSKSVGTARTTSP